MYSLLAYASALLLVLAIGDWPYGYYTFLRIAVSITAVFGAFRALRAGLYGWVFALAAVAVLFNPMVPIYMAESDWMVFDLFAATVMAISGIILGSPASNGS